MTTQHIYWFAYFNTEEPSVRYRAKYALEELAAQHKLTYDLVFPGYSPLTVLKFVITFFSIIVARKPNSVIVFEKIHTQRIYATALKLLLRIKPDRTFYDIDDADYLKFPPETIYHFIKHCSACTVGSQSIADFACKMNKNVLLLTSPVVDHRHIKTYRNKELVIGWIGYYNAHRESLMQLFFPSLKDVSIPVKLLLMGVTKQHHREELANYFVGIKNVTLEIPQDIDWQNEDEIYRTISTIDIGIAPLLNTEINKAKSAFKLKQYMSCGIPVLGSGTGENKVFLKHGINGYVCDSSQDYEQHIMKISEMSDTEYGSLSVHALDTKKLFSMHYYCTTLMHLLDIHTQQA